MSGLLAKEEKHADDRERVEEQQLVVFRMEGESFGVEIFKVNEIIRLQQITPIPNSPRHLLGLVNLRGKTIPVFDLRCRLGMPLAVPTNKSRIMVVEAEGERIGVVVDEVTEVLSIQSDEREPTPELLSGHTDDCVTEIVKHDSRLITLLDLDKVLVA